MDYATWIKDGLKRTRKSQSALARHLGIHRSRVTEILQGRRHLRANEVAMIEVFLGAPAPSLLKQAHKYEVGLPIVGAIDEKVWRMQDDEAPPARASHVLPLLDSRYPIADQVIFIMACASRDPAVAEGDHLIAVPFSTYRKAPLPGDLLIVTRTEGQFSQTGLRRAHRNGGAVELKSVTAGAEKPSEGDAISHLVIAVTRPLT